MDWLAFINGACTNTVNNIYKIYEKKYEELRKFVDNAEQIAINYYISYIVVKINPDKVAVIIYDKNIK